MLLLLFIVFVLAVAFFTKELNLRVQVSHLIRPDNFWNVSSCVFCNSTASVSCATPLTSSSLSFSGLDVFGIRMLAQTRL